MKQHTLLFILITIIPFSKIFSQTKNTGANKEQATIRVLTIEPGIGIHTNFGTDLLFTNLVQWNPKKRIAIVSYSSYNINNIFLTKFNGVSTEYNYSINQKFGIGTTFYAKRSSNTFLFLAGAKYTTYKETLVDPDKNKVSASINSFSPDYGLMYSLKKGVKKYFFSFRMYIPLYPWPVKDISTSVVDGNMNNISLEFGVGLKIK